MDRREWGALSPFSVGPDESGGAEPGGAEAPTPTPETPEEASPAASEALDSKGRQRLSVPASDIRVNDYLDDRTRVSKVHAVNGKVMVQTKVQGSTSPSVQQWDANATVKIRRTPTKEAPDALPTQAEADVAGPSDGGDPIPDFPGPAVAPAESEADEDLAGVPSYVATLIGPGDKVYSHPQGSYIVASPNGAIVKLGPDGKPKKTSATAAKLAVGHGGWSPVELSKSKPETKPVDPPVAVKPLTDLEPAKAVVVSDVKEVELPSKPAPAGSKFSVPMAFNEAPVSEVPKYIEDPDFVFQQKVDGIRGQLVVEPGKKPWFRARSGQALQNASATKITSGILSSLGTMPEEGPSYTVDGELLNGRWYVFDVIPDGSEKMPYSDRLAVTEAWVGEMHKAGLKQIQPLPTARTPDEKRALWEAMNAQGGEGVMMKRLDAGYNPGSRVNHSLKAKITSTADVVVMERNTKGHENATIGVRVGGELKPIGTVSMQGKEKGGAVNVGDVIEVEYLWAMPGSNTLQQPRMVRKRPDKKPGDVDDGQLRFVSKDVLDKEGWDSAEAAPEAAAADAAGTDTPVPDDVAAILDKWVKLRGSGELSDDERKTLLAQIISGGEKAPTLYRGANIGVDASEFVPGRPIDLSPSASSEEEGSALPYAESGDQTPVLFVLEGARGLSVADRAEKVSGYAEQEWVTGGRFYVRSSSRDDDGNLVVSLAPTLGADPTSQKNATKPPLDVSGRADAPTPTPEADETPVSPAEEASPPKQPAHETPAAPAAPTGPAADPLQAEIDRQATFGTTITGDPHSPEGMMVVNKQHPDQISNVRRTDEGWTFTDSKGKERALSSAYPELYAALSAGEPKSWEGLDPKKIGSGTSGGWTERARFDAAVDMDMPREPYPPYSYGSSSPPMKAMSAYYNASAAWRTELERRLQAGGPPRVEVRVDDPASASDADLESELGRLSGLAQAAHADSAAVQDAGMNKALDAMDHYKSGMSDKRVALINRAAGPLRAEMLRRVNEQFQSAAEPGFDRSRWPQGAEQIAPTTTRVGSLPPDEAQRIRDTYVVKDKNTIDKNASLRSGAPSAAAKTWRGKTDKWVGSSVASKDGVVFRGIAVPPAVLRQFRPGAMITDPGVISTDHDLSNALYYLNTRMGQRPDALPVMLEILVPKGQAIVDAGYGELVMPSNTSMVVREVRIDDDGTYRVTVEAGGRPGEGGADDGDGAGVGGVTASGLRARVHEVALAR